jgi:rfaE bifunctional protein nucleotidyltransferase chain/domain
LGADPKILGREALACRVGELKSSGLKVVFTNGVFDILHVGHLRYLREARRRGDVLVVGLNSDVSVKGLKGDRRPILPQLHRAELLAGLSCVDYVCIFDEPDPRALIAAVRPGLLVKGGDWPVEKILGSDTVMADGGQVLSLPFVPGESTTTIVKSIVERYKEGFQE